MKKKYSILALLLVFALLAGCGSGAASASSVSAEASSAVQEEEAALSAQAEESEAPEEPDSAASAAEGSEAEEMESDYTPEQQALIDLIPEGEYLTFQSYPLTEDAETLSLLYTLHPLMTAYYEDAADIPIFSSIEEITGVHIDFMTVSMMAAETQIQLLIASGDLMDIMPLAANYTAGADAAIAEELIVDLTEYLPEYGVNYQGLIDGNSTFGDAVTTAEGRIAGYSLYSMDNTRIYIYGPEIRMDWLNEVGMEIPETMDEYHDVLLAFKNLIGCETPMWLHYSGINRDNLLTRAYDIDGEGYLLIDGQVTSSLTQPGFKSYLEMMNLWYSEGLVAQDFFSDTSREEPELAVVADDTYGLFFQYASEYPELESYASDPDFEIQAIPEAVLNTGDKLYISNGTSSEAAPEGSFNITTACSNVELAVQWMDFFYSPDGWLLCNYGTEGLTFAYDDEGVPHWTDVITASELPSLVIKSTYTMLQWSFLFDASREFDSYTDEMIEASDIWASVETDGDYLNLPVYVTLSGDVSSEVLPLQSDIDTYVDECLVKFIVGDMNFEEDYDTFIDTLEMLGLQTVIDAYQDAYDAASALRAA